MATRIDQAPAQRVGPTSSTTNPLQAQQLTELRGASIVPADRTAGSAAMQRLTDGRSGAARDASLASFEDAARRGLDSAGGGRGGRVTDSLQIPTPRSKASRSDVASIPGVQDVVARARAAGLYRQPIPNNQDGQAHAVPGLGGAYVDALEPMVFSPRRQTDQMVRQAFALLPPSLTRDVAFVHAQRVAQDPEGAARLLEGKKQVVIVGSLKGINTATSDDPKVSAIHEKELKALELSMQLSKAMGVEVRDVVYGMGDSSPKRNGKGGFTPNPFAEQKRAQLEGRVQGILRANGYEKPERLSWGADELMLSAFAAQLPERTVAVHLQHPDARYFYDSDATAQHLAREAAGKAGLRVVESGPADVQLYGFGLSPRANRAGDQLFPDASERTIQRASDAAFAARIRSLSPEERARTLIVDARLNNGAMDDTALPPSLDMLGFSAWGTGGNNFGQGLAMAKIVRDAQERARGAGDPAAAGQVEGARKQLLVESMAHDGFFIGYAQGASGISVGAAGQNPLTTWMRAQGLPEAPGVKLSEQQLVGLYRQASARATSELRRRFPDLEGRIQFVPQPFNRRFEAATLFSGGVLANPGSISEELVKKYPEFHPAATYGGHMANPPGAAAVMANGRFDEP